MSEIRNEGENLEVKTAKVQPSPQFEIDGNMSTEDLLLVGAKTMAGIGIGFVVIVLGATGIGAGWARAESARALPKANAATNRQPACHATRLPS